MVCSRVTKDYPITREDLEAVKLRLHDQIIEMLEESGLEPQRFFLQAIKEAHRNGLISDYIFDLFKNINTAANSGRHDWGSENPFDIPDDVIETFDALRILVDMDLPDKPRYSSEDGWSSELLDETWNVIVEKRFVPRDEKIYLKNINGDFGYIAVTDWMSDRLVVLDHNGGEQLGEYYTFDEFVEDGWAVD